MGQETTDSSDLLTVDERFFLHIALKNGLLDQAQADRALEACRAGGVALEQALRGLRLLDDAQMLKVREAMAASQVVRMDTVYADVLLHNGVAAAETIEAAFSEQRRQRYRVRLGNLLVERRVISPEQHRAIISEVIRRLKELGPEAYGSTVERRGRQAERSALGQPSSRLGGPVPDAAASDSARSPFAGGPPGSPDPWSATPAAARGPARGWARSGLDDPAVDTRAGHDDPLLQSALRIGLSSESGVLTLHRSDEAAARRDLLALSRSSPFDESGVSAQGRGASGPPSASFVLDRVALSASAEDGDGFDAEQYVQARRRRRRALFVAGGAAGAAALAGVVSAGLALASNRHALADVRALMSEAQAASDPEAKRGAYLRASERLSAVGGLGVGGAVRAELRDRVRWGALQAEALALMAAQRPDDARQLLERRRAEVPALARSEHDALLREAARDHALALARSAEARADWAAAVAAYRDARDQGDPGSVIGTRLAAIRADLLQRMDALHERALETLTDEHEVAFTRAAKLVTELFNEDQGLTERLEEIQYRRAMARGEELLRRDEVEAAQQAFDVARRLRPGRREVDPWLLQVGARRELKEEERRGREAEARARWDEAVEFYGRAQQLATRAAERRRLEEAVARCRAQGRQDDARRRRAGALEEATQHLRASRVAAALAALEELARSPRPEPAVARLLELARKVEGMVYVPAGPFRMGSRPDDPLARPVEQPQRTLELPAYFIGRTEVTNAEYARFVAAGEVPPPPHWTYPVRQQDGSVRTSYDPGIAEHPVVNVTWRQARAYAAWRGGRLPGEAQWEKAARGPAGGTYPWGEGVAVRVHVQVPPDRLRGHPTAPVGGYADDTSPYGVQDMAGNVGEWTDDPFAPYPGAPGDLDWPSGRRAIRGGAYRWRFEDARCAARDRGEEDGYVSPTVGLRVVIEVPPELAELR